MRTRRDVYLIWSVVTLALLLLAASGCSGAGPREVVVGEDQCGYCRMEVTDTRHASQVVTSTGKVHVFDSVECVAGFVREARAAGTEVRSTWVRDAVEGGAWVRAEDAGFLLDGALRGSMGRAASFASVGAAEQARQRLGGTIVSWNALVSDSAGVASHASH